MPRHFCAELKQKEDALAHSIALCLAATDSILLWAGLLQCDSNAAFKHNSAFASCLDEIGFLAPPSRLLP